MKGGSKARGRLREMIAEMWQDHTDREIKVAFEVEMDKLGVLSEIPLSTVRDMRLRMGLKREDKSFIGGGQRSNETHDEYVHRIYNEHVSQLEEQDRKNEKYERDLLRGMGLD